jgi:hypothetical protein
MNEAVAAPLEKVLGRLGRVKRGPAGFVARCPAHEDRHPSLSVGEGDDGRVLVRCHAGCSADAIVSALGLELRDLFPETERGGNGNCRILEAYDYVDEAGDLLYQAVRFEPKGFAQRRPDATGWSWKLGDTRRVLYRLPRVLGAASRGETVYVCEGERDVHAVEELGFVATTNPMGAGKWRDEYAEAFRGAGRVIVLPDDDEPGRNHATDVATSLVGVASDVRVVELWQRGDTAADVSDWLAPAKTVVEREQARRLLAEIADRTAKFSIPPPIALKTGGKEDRILAINDSSDDCHATWTVEAE